MCNPIRHALSAAVVIASLGAGQVVASDGFQAGRKGLSYKTDDFEARLGGRLQWDVGHIDDDGADSDEQEIRRGRLELRMRLQDDWRIRVDREFTNGGGWRNVWLSYDVTNRLTIKGGNFTAPFSMEDVASSNTTMFMERSLVHALSPGFGMGAGAQYQGRHYSFAAGYFSDALDDDNNIQAEKGDGVSMRATWNPIERRKQILHLGFGLDRRDFDGGDSRLISTRPESHLAPTVITTRVLSNLEKSTSYNLEGAYSVGPVLLQSQFISTDLDRTTGGDLKLDGYYAQAGWVLTGERHIYRDSVGVFDGVKPRHAWGAFELAVRLSSLDLGEAGAAASGKADDYSAGLNWYLGRNFRLMTNYVHSNVDAVNPARDRDMDIVQARAQLRF